MPSTLEKKSCQSKLQAYISLQIVWLFLFCHVWKLVPTAYEVATLQGDGIENEGENVQWPAW